MAIPSGSGSEVLKRTTVNAQSSTVTSFDWASNTETAGTSSVVVPALHIITVLNVIFAAQSTDRIEMYANDGTSDIYFIWSQTIPALGTFVWNDRIVLHPGDKLNVDCINGGANIDIWCNFIDQD